jgi:tetratricopeptide (TPR) repeat protein
VRDLLESGRLSNSGFSRLALNGWLPEQSVLSWISGLDPVTLVLQYLAPTLVVVALLALYALARTLLSNEKAALVIVSLSALFFLVAFGSTSFHSVLAPGGEFVRYVTEDKFVARYVFLPVALSLAILFVRDQSRRNLGLFFFVCLSVAVVHPLGLVFIGACIAGFGLVHLAATGWRDQEAWRKVGGLWLALFVIAGPPALYLLTTQNHLLFRLDAAEPSTAATLTENWQYEQRLLKIGEGSYIAHPSLLLDPAMLAVCLVGVPFLIWKAKKHAREGPAAQLLLGVLVFVPMLTFVPYTTTLISNIIGPWMLYRLTWPLLLAALLTLGWMCWEALRLVGFGLDGFRLTRRVIPFLPLIVVGYLSLNAVPVALAGIRGTDDVGKVAQDESTCLDPTFRWMQETIPTHSRVMAPRLESPCVTAHVASADVLGGRGQVSSRIRQDLEAFYAPPTLGPNALRALERHQLGYVLLPANSPLNAQFEHLPGFARMDNPGERYRMYEVTNQQKAFEQTLPVVANGNLNDGERDKAIEAYEKILEEDTSSENRQFLAYVGLGLAYTEEEQYAEAIENYQAAVEIDPQSTATHELLANALYNVGEKDRAWARFEQAVDLDPNNTSLRLRYGRLLATEGYRREAVEEHEAVVEMFPEVPDYRARLASALLLTGAAGAADEQFERAISLAPLSAKLRADIAGTNLSVGRLEEALEHYEEALRLEPNSQLYALSLGRVHARLSSPPEGGGRDEGHFEEAEALLESVEELSHRPWEDDQREAARIALGDLYREWGRVEAAAAAYELALELNPDSEEAKEKLEDLRQQER